MKLVFTALIVVAIFLCMISQDMAIIKNYLMRGGMFEHENVYVQLKDVSWNNLPVELREQIALKYRNTKLNKKDFEELVVLYTKLRDEYTEPIVITK
jgi:hypothetical protein